AQYDRLYAVLLLPGFAPGRAARLVREQSLRLARGARAAQGARRVRPRRSRADGSPGARQQCRPALHRAADAARRNRGLERGTTRHDRHARLPRRRGAAAAGARPLTTLRTGAEFLRSLADGRQIFLDGERVDSVVKHPALRGAAGSIAKLFDIAAAPELRERMTYPSPTTNGPVWRAWQIPRSHADLAAKRLFSQTWAEATFGLMGRTPDHVAGFFAGFAAVPKVFAAAGANFADNVVRFYERARDNHLYISYAIVPPQIDRSKPAHQQRDPTLYAGVVQE